MSELKEYRGTMLVASEAKFLEDLEKKIQKEIPCIDDRDKSKKQTAEMNQRIHAQQQAAQAAQTQSPLAMQYQQVQAYEAQLDQQAQLPLEGLEDFYLNQFIATISPQYKAQIQAQLNAFLPSLGENHPTIKQFKDILDLDESKAKEKAKSMAQFYFQYFKLRALNKVETQKMNKAMYSPTISLDDMIKSIKDCYNTTTTPEYQAMLKDTIDIGNNVAPNDPNLAKLKTFLGMNDQMAHQYAQQVAQQMFQNIQTMTQQYQAINTQSQQNSQPTSQIGASDHPIDLGSYLGFVSDENHIVGLNLFNLGLINLPENTCNLSRLKVLHAKWNKIEELPEEIGNLLALEELDLDGNWSNNDDRPIENEISILPDSFCKLKNLKIFKCGSNGLKSLPDSFGQLTSLEEVKLDSNRIQKIPDSIGNIPKIEKLDFSTNKIEVIPPSLCNLSTLKWLLIGYNSINKIPECIDQLSSLSDLYLSGNNISELPPSLFNLTSLNYLRLSNNQLKDIPEDIIKLNLTHLFAEENQITTLPYFIWQMKALENLYLKGNPLSSEELELVENDAQTIKDYCRQRASIAIMVIFSEKDAATHRLPEILSYLEAQSEVFGILPGKEDNLQSADLIIFLATDGSINSPEAIELLEKAKKMEIGIVPLKGTNIGWVDLANIGLSRELGHEFTPDDFDGFCTNVYSYIQLLKRNHNVFKDKSKFIQKEDDKEEKGGLNSFESFKSEFSRIIHSQKVKDFFNSYQQYLKPQYDNAVKQQAIPMFFTVFAQLFQTYLAQNKGGT